MSRFRASSFPDACRKRLRPLGHSFTGGFHAWTATGAASILAFCVCATLGQLTLTMAFSRGNMVLSGALQYTVILFSTLMGVLIFGDDVSFTSAVGMVTIVVSGIAASLLTKRTEGHIKAIKSLRTLRPKALARPQSRMRAASADQALLPPSRLSATAQR